MCDIAREPEREPRPSQQGRDSIPGGSIADAAKATRTRPLRWAGSAGHSGEGGIRTLRSMLTRTLIGTRSCTSTERNVGANSVLALSPLVPVSPREATGVGQFLGIEWAFGRSDRGVENHLLEPRELGPPRS